MHYSENSTYLFSRAKVTLGSGGRERAHELHTPLAERGEHLVSARYFDGEAIRVSQLCGERHSFPATGDSCPCLT